MTLKIKPSRALKTTGTRLVPKVVIKTDKPVAPPTEAEKPAEAKAPMPTDTPKL